MKDTHYLVRFYMFFIAVLMMVSIASSEYAGSLKNDNSILSKNNSNNVNQTNDDINNFKKINKDLNESKILKEVNNESSSESHNSLHSNLSETNNSKEITIWNNDSMAIIGIDNNLSKQSNEKNISKENHSESELLHEIDQVDYAIRLNGITGRILISNSTGLDGFSQGTWNIWVKQNSYVNFAPLFSKYATNTGSRAYIIRISNGNSISVLLSADGNTYETHTSIINKACGITTNNEWTMITITYDGSRIFYYKDGIYCDESTVSTLRINTSPIPLTIGNYGSTYLNGSVDDASIYNRKLTSAEILYLYNTNTHKKTRIPILTYHRIDSNANERYKVTPANFNKQMSFIQSRGFTAVTIYQYNMWRNNNFTMPSRPVIITFDDGHRSVYTQALPIMNNYSLKGTANIVTNYANQIEGGSSYMPWSEIKHIKNKGWDIQSHSVNHTNQILLSPTNFRYQLNFSKRNVSVNTGLTPVAYVFPFSSANDTYTTICGQYYSLCFTRAVNPENPFYVEKNTPGTIYGSLKRINVYNSTNIQTFQGIFSKLIPANQIPYQPIAKWQMNEGQGSVTLDFSGNAHNGLLSSGATWQLAG